MPQSNKKLNIILTGGGTGGHIYPAIAVGRELLSRNNVEKVFYIGNPEKLEKIITEKEDFEFLPVKVSGMPKKKDFSMIMWLFELGIAVLKCIGYLKKIKPDCVMGTGGYVSGPALIAAKILGIPYILHDSDAVPGIVSRTMSSGAKAMNLSFGEAKKYLKTKNIQVNGNPLRGEFNILDKAECLKELGLSPDKFTILVMGGSQGAKSINAAISACALDLIEESGVQIIHQTGLKNYDEYMDGISSELRNNPSYFPKAYIENIPVYLSCADLVVARAGSLSLSEFNLSGLPSVLIPYPYAANNHQYHNAKALENAGAAICLEDNLCDGDNLREIVFNLINDKDKMETMRKANLKLAKPDATKNITDLLLSITR